MAARKTSRNASSVLLSLPVAGLKLLYGLVVLLLALVFVARRRSKGLVPSDDELHIRASVSRQFWSLEDDPEAQLDHKFLQLQDGTQLHYLSPRASPRTADVLVVFAHGFPDSSYLWADRLRSGTFRTAKVVSLDLPGCGGSDDLDSYGPDEVLNAFTETVVLLKQRYLRTANNAPPRCLLVAHDWGGVIGYRLAAETKGLFDDMIILNSFYPHHFGTNVDSRMSKFRQHLRAWRQRPFTATNLTQAWEGIVPILVQLWKFGYTFMFMLPVPLARYFPGLAISLIRVCHLLSHRGSTTPSDHKLALSWAASSGPSAAEAETTSSAGVRYGPSVVARAHTIPPGNWDQRVRLYKERLTSGPWTPRGAAASYAVATPDSDAQPGIRFTCRVRVIFGLRDEALDARMCLDGIEQFFPAPADDADAGSTDLRDDIVRLPSCGHWSPLDPAGRLALDEMLQRVLGQPL